MSYRLLNQLGLPEVIVREIIKFKEPLPQPPISIYNSGLYFYISFAVPKLKRMGVRDWRYYTLLPPICLCYILNYPSFLF